MSNFYVRLMIILARYLAYPQRVYHAVSGSQNPTVRMLTPLLIPVVMLVSLPAYIVGAIAVVLGQNRQPQQEQRQETEINNFPIHQMSDDDFSRVREKVLYILNATPSEKVTLILSSGELNTLRSKAHFSRFPIKTANSFHPPDYYTIRDTDILEQSMAVPMPNEYGYYQATHSISYFSSNTELLEERRLIEEQGNQVENNLTVTAPLERSKLILIIFKSIVEREKIPSVIQNIRNVYIENCSLHIYFTQCDGE